MEEAKLYTCFEAENDLGEHVYVIYSAKLSDLHDKKGGSKPVFNCQVVIKGLQSMGCGVFDSKIVLAGGIVTRGEDQRYRHGMITYDTQRRRVSYVDIPPMQGLKIRPIVFELCERLVHVYMFTIARLPDKANGALNFQLKRRVFHEYSYSDFSPRGNKSLSLLGCFALEESVEDGDDIPIPFTPKPRRKNEYIVEDDSNSGEDDWKYHSEEEDLGSDVEIYAAIDPTHLSPPWPLTTDPVLPTQTQPFPHAKPQSSVMDNNMEEAKLYTCFEAENDLGEHVYVIYSAKLSDLHDKKGGSKPVFNCQVVIKGLQSMGCGVFDSKIVLAGGIVTRGEDQRYRHGMITYDTQRRRVSYVDIPPMQGLKIRPIVFELCERLVHVYMFTIARLPDKANGALNFQLKRRVFHEYSYSDFSPRGNKSLSLLGCFALEESVEDGDDIPIPFTPKPRRKNEYIVEDDSNSGEDDWKYHSEEEDLGSDVEIYG
ncbi:hypothetical protein AgCh_011170 [Apium graveolens]